MNEYLEIAKDYIIEYSPKIISAIIILIVGFIVIKYIKRFSNKIMVKREVEDTLRKFSVNLINWILKILLFIIVISQLGVQTTSFVAILGAAGLAVGLALQGSLANFAGGVLILLFKHFKVGDLIEAQGEIGVVKEIQIFTTRLIGLSNKEIIIPNGVLSNDTIVNYTIQGTRRVDLVIGVDYDADIKQTKDVLMKVLTSNSKILSDPAPTVSVLELADSSVNFAVRPWVNADDYWPVYFEVMEETKLALDEAGIDIPYPHRVQVQK